MAAKEIKSSALPPRGPLWQAFYRWHFSAGMLLLPFFVMLSVTGIVYLFKPQLEPKLYQDAWKVVPGTVKQSADAMAKSAQAAVEEGKLKAFAYANSADDAAQFTVKDKQGVDWRVWVDPYSGRLTGRVAEDGMLMQVVRELHGELLLDTPGAILMDLVALCHPI